MSVVLVAKSLTRLTHRGGGEGTMSGIYLPLVKKGSPPISLALLWTYTNSIYFAPKSHWHGTSGPGDLNGWSWRPACAPCCRGQCASVFHLSPPALALLPLWKGATLPCSSPHRGPWKPRRSVTSLPLLCGDPPGETPTTPSLAWGPPFTLLSWQLTSMKAAEGPCFSTNGRPATLVSKCSTSAKDLSHLACVRAHMHEQAHVRPLWQTQHSHIPWDHRV